MKQAMNKPLYLFFFITICWACYSGGNSLSDEYYPTKFFVFDINGDYIQTLETGYRISDYCFDKENNRIILNLDDEIQFAYLDLKGLVE